MPVYVAVSDIVANPWRDLKLSPLDDEHVHELVKSIHEHGFFATVKGRRRHGKVELGFGHARLAAAKLAKLSDIPVFIDDEMDDDTMLRLMTAENALQSGASPGAVMNEIAAVIRRLIEGVHAPIVPKPVARAFADAHAVEIARGKLQKRLHDPKADVPIGFHAILRYLGQGDEKAATRGVRQVRETIEVLKQSGRYDQIVEAAIRTHVQPVAGKPLSSGKAATQTPPSSKPRRIFDESTANYFPNEHQFHTFRSAVTTEAAQRVLPVESQKKLAREIMDSQRGESNKRHVGAPYIQTMVRAKVEEGLRQQRAVDKEERDRLFRQQMNEEIETSLHSANANLRGLLSAIAKLSELGDKYPMHPRITGFSAKLDELSSIIEQFSKRLNRAKV